MDQYKVDLGKYRLSIQLRNQARNQINLAFIDAVDKANHDARFAMKLAKTVAAKTDVIEKQKNAITAACSARDIALATLGDLPLAPLKPSKEIELVPYGSMKTQKSSPSSTGKSRN